MRKKLFCLHLPRRLAVVKIPLVAKRHDAVVATATDDLALGLSVLEGQASIDHLLLHLALGFRHRLALECALQHATVVEALLVCHVLSFGQSVLVLRALDLELLDEVSSNHVTVAWRLHDGHRVLRHPLRVDLVKLGLLAKLHQHRIVVWRVTWHTRNDACALRREHRVHWHHVYLLVGTKRCMDLGTDQRCARHGCQAFHTTALVKDALVGKVACSALRADV